MTLDLSPVIARFAMSLERRRRAAPTYSAGGIATPGAQTIDTIRGHVQPLDPRRAQVLREGIREGARYSVWTSAAVRTVDETSELPPDEIVYGGRLYRVHSVEAWEQHGLFRELAMVDAGPVA